MSSNYEPYQKGNKLNIGELKITIQGNEFGV